MSQSLLYHAFGVRAGYEYVRTDYQAGAVQFHLAVQAELFVCPVCQSAHVIRKGARERSLQTVPIGLNPDSEVELPQRTQGAQREGCRAGPPGKNLAWFGTHQTRCPAVRFFAFFAANFGIRG